MQMSNKNLLPFVRIVSSAIVDQVIRNSNWNRNSYDGVWRTKLHNIWQSSISVPLFDVWLKLSMCHFCFVWQLNWSWTFGANIGAEMGFRRICKKGQNKYGNLEFVSFCRLLPADSWLNESQQMQNLLERVFQSMVQASAGHAAEFVQRIQELRRTQIEREVKQAMGKWDIDSELYSKDIQFSSFFTQPCPARKSWQFFAKELPRAAKRM